MPAWPSRMSSCRIPSPQSISRWVSCVSLRAWTTVALPELPLPRLLNRITSLQVIGDDLNDALRVRRSLRRSVGIEHRHGSRLALALEADAVLQRGFGLFRRAEQLS